MLMAIQPSFSYSATTLNTRARPDLQPVRPQPVVSEPAQLQNNPEVRDPEPAKLPEMDSSREPERINIEDLEAKEPETTPSEPVSQISVGSEVFRQALAVAYTSNPNIKAERENLKGLDENMPQALSGWLPTARVNAERGRQRNNIDNTGWNYEDVDTKQLVVSQPVFNGGETIAQTRSARHLIKAGRAQLLNVEQTTLFNAVTAYMDVVRDQSVLDLSKKNVDVLRQQSKASKDRFDVGEVTRTDVAQSDARVSQAEADRIQAQGNLASSRANYKRVIGSDSATLLVGPKTLPPIPDTLEEVMEIALVYNPTINLTKHRAISADSDVDVRIADLLPDLSLNASMNRDDNAGQGGSTEFDTDAVTLNLTVPLYQSGAEWSRVRQAKAIKRQRDFNALDAHDETRQLVTRAWEQYQTAKAKIVSNKESIAAAEIALSGVRQEQLYGARTTLDVLDAERELFVTRVDFVRSERDEMVAAYNLLAVMGRLNPAYLDLGVKPYDPKEHYNSVKFQFIGF